MDKLIIIEPSKDGAEHLTFNSLVISSLLDNSSKLVFLATSKSHYEALGKPTKNHIVLPVVSIVNRHFVRKVVVEFFAILKAMIYAWRNGIRHAVFLSVFPPLLLLIPLIAKLLRISTIIILHGELEGLVDNNRMRITSFGFWVKLFFNSFCFERVTCFVLSEGIYRRLLTLYPNIDAYVKWAIHPIVDQANQDIREREFDFSTVGVATKKKHGLLFEKLTDLSHFGPRIAHIGMTEPELFDRYNNEITFFCRPGEHLSQNDFLYALNRVKTAIFPYDDTSYKMTVSGAMLDAIGCGCKIVCLPNDFARDLLEEGLPILIVNNFDSLLNLVEQENTGEIPWEKFSPDIFCHKLLSGFRN